MNGQIEETAYRISQLNSRLDKLVSDVDYRLTALEGGKPASTPAEATTPQNQNQNATPQQAPATAQQPGTLGTLSQQDLNQPQPKSVSQGVSSTALDNPAAPKPAEKLSPDAFYAKSHQMLMRGEYDQAEQSFKAFLDQYPTDEKAGNARYWLAETYYARGDYARAAATFLHGYQKAPQGAKAPDSLLKLGMSLNKMGDKKKEACATFAKLRSAFPKLPAHLSKTLERERTQAGCN
jgi:tol-pal system protein YbgF